jgi:predicted DNA-binding transcriptional regulator YafY
MPISGEAGPGGGVRLAGERGQAAVHLSVTEIVALWLGARLARGASDLPWSGDAYSAMAKLLASLPTQKARALRALSRRVVVGQPASPAVRAGAARAPRELLTLFEQAFSSGVGLGFVYSDRERRQSQRRVEPHGLLGSGTCSPVTSINGSHVRSEWTASPGRESWRTSSSARTSP